MDLFDKVSIEEWQEKLRKDLKSEDLSEYNWHLDDEISVSPFLHAPEEKVQLLSSEKGWKVGFSYSTDIDKNSLPSFIEKYDVDAIMIDSTDEFMECRDSLPPNLKIAILEKNSDSELTNRYSEHLYVNSNKTNEAYSSHNSLIEIDTADRNSSISNILADNLYDLHSHLEYIYNKDREIEAINSIWSTILLGNSHFRNIAILRSWRMLGKKLFDAWEVKADMPLWARLKAENKNEDPYIKQIDFSWQFLSAVVSDADFIIVPSLKFDNSDTASARLPVNTSHILREESRLQKYRDPMAGSYFMEELCDKICKSSWKKFQSKV